MNLQGSYSAIFLYQALAMVRLDYINGFSEHLLISTKPQPASY